MTTNNLRHIRHPMEYSYELLDRKKIISILPNDSDGFYVRVETNYSTKKYTDEILTAFDYLYVYNVEAKKNYLEIVFAKKG